MAALARSASTAGPDDSYLSAFLAKCAMAESEGAAAQMMGIRVMNDDAVQADEEDHLSYEVSDEALETAAGNEALPAWTMMCSGISCPG
jgi:hypothetical protein